MKIVGQGQSVMMIYVSGADVSFWRESLIEMPECHRLDSESVFYTNGLLLVCM